MGYAKTGKRSRTAKKRPPL